MDAPTVEKVLDLLMEDIRTGQSLDTFAHHFLEQIVRPTLTTKLNILANELATLHDE